MGRVKDLSGMKFNRLTVIEFSYVNEKRSAIWKCLCECGCETLVRGYCLTSGHTQSCGCLSLENRVKATKTHGRSKNDPTYTSWLAMKARCSNPKLEEYPHYGGRGIRVEDEEWLSCFEKFLEDMGERPTGTTLDRVDVNKGYYKENCRWTTQDVQTYNQRMPARNTSGKVGVVKSGNKWVVDISVDGERIYLGTFEDFELACHVRDEAELKYYGSNRKNDKPDI